jgi:hypothetical protein
MIEEQKYEPDEEIIAYNILLQRHLNDDRLMGERTAIFLASSSILFLGFAVLPQDAWFVLRVIIPFFGICWSVLAIVSNRRTSLALDFWEAAEEQIEESGTKFKYLEEKKLSTHFMYEVLRKRWLTVPRNRHIFSLILPSLFIVIWIASLIWVMIS